METFSALQAICAGNSPVTGGSRHKGQWRRTLMFSLICVWINGWVNNSEAGDFRRYRAHYDVTVMVLRCTIYACHCCNKRSWMSTYSCDLLWFIPQAKYLDVHEECCVRCRYQLHSTYIVGCNYFSLPLMPASGTTLLIYEGTCVRNRHQGQGQVTTSHIYCGM